MVPRNTDGPASPGSSLKNVATQFLLQLPPQDSVKAQQEVYKFIRWYGEERNINELTIPEVAGYTEQITSSTTEVTEKLGVIKAFLTYSHKQQLTLKNLAVHLKVKKSSSRPTSTRRHPHRTVMLTTQGHADLQAELVALKNERPRIAEDLQKAAADKDFRENAPLDAIREYQGQLEARIRELESTLNVATLMDDKKIDGAKAIDIGAMVLLRDLVSGEGVNYTLVDASEAKPTEHIISASSPMGQALLGRKKGDKVEVRAPVGILHYQIEDIKHR